MNALVQISLGSDSGIMSRRSQLSDQILICLPSPTLHNAPLAITFHAYEAERESFAFKIDPLGKNLALKTLWKRDFSSLRSHHANLANIASLNVVRSLNPIPP